MDQRKEVYVWSVRLEQRNNNKTSKEVIINYNLSPKDPRKGFTLIF